MGNLEQCPSRSHIVCFGRGLNKVASQMTDAILTLARHCADATRILHLLIFAF